MPPRRVVRAGTEVTETIFALETAFGIGSGLARLVPDPSVSQTLRAWTMVTTLDALHPEQPGIASKPSPEYSREFGGGNKARADADHEPAVIIIVGRGPPRPARRRHADRRPS